MKKLLVLVSVLFFVLLAFRSPALPLLALPDIGINYSTMQVDNPGKIQQAGMPKAVMGDKVQIVIGQNKSVSIVNQRTGERISLPLGAH